MIDEIWSTIDGHPNYEVSTWGRVNRKMYHVMRNDRWGNLSPMICRAKPCALNDNGRGYKMVSIKSGYKGKNLYVHRLVAQAFIPNTLNLPEVNHKDGNKENNSVYNLEWVSLQQNRDHAVMNDLISRGERSPHSKLKERDVIEILHALKANPNLNKSELGRKYGVGCEAIIKLQKGQRWKYLTKAIHI